MKKKVLQIIDQEGKNQVPEDQYDVIFVLKRDIQGSRVQL